MLCSISLFRLTLFSNQHVAFISRSDSEWEGSSSGSETNDANSSLRKSLRTKSKKKQPSDVSLNKTSPGAENSKPQEDKGNTTTVPVAGVMEKLFCSSTVRSFFKYTSEIFGYNDSLVPKHKDVHVPQED